LDIFKKLFPQFMALAADTPERFNHTKRRLDEAVTLAQDLSKEKRLALMLAALCQDLGDSQDSTLAVLGTLGVFTVEADNVREQVLALGGEAGRPGEFYDDRERTTDGDFRRLARRVDMNLLYRLAKADALAHGLPVEAAEWFIERARALDVENGAPDPLLLG